MAKQTLFEAEGVITINAGKMLSGLDAAIAQAQAKLNNAFNNFNWPSPGGGGGGGGGRGGSGGNSQQQMLNTYYAVEREMAKQEAAIGRLHDAHYRLQSLAKLSILTEEQRARAETARLAVAQKLADKRVRMETEQKKHIDKKDVTAGRVQRENFGDQMAEARRLKNAHEYARALDVINGLLAQQLTRRQHIQVLDLKNRTEQQNAMFDPNMLNPGARRANAAIQNASFAIQDFVTVLSMGGGMSRALASASNNLGFMAAMMNTVKGAMIGLGLTLAAVFLPDLAKAAFGIKDFGKSADEAANRIKRLELAIRDAASEFRDFDETQQMTIGADRDSLIKKRQGIRTDIGATKASLAAAKSRTEIARSGLVDDFYDAMGGRNMVSEDIRMLMDGVRSGTTTIGKLKKASKDKGSVFDSGLRENLGESAKRLEDIEAPVKDLEHDLKMLGRSLQDATEAIDLLKSQKDITELLDPKTWSGTGPDRVLNGSAMGPLPVGAKDKMFDFNRQRQAELRRDAKEKAAEARRLEMNELQKKAPALKSMFETLFPKEAEVEAIKKRYEDAFGARGSRWDLRADAMEDFEISQVKNKSMGSISGTMGGADFANQLTNQLLRSDPQTKIAQEAAKHTGLLDAIKIASEKTADRIEELEKSAITD
jgi:hypothetical protein